MKIRLVFVSILCLLLTACERVVNIDMPAHTPVVVNGLFYADSTWRIRVARAWAIGEYIHGMSTNKLIEDASVTIIPAGGDPVALAYDTDGYYISPLKAKAGEQYELAVYVPGEPLITSSTVLPPPVTIDRVEISEEGYKTVVTLEFTDIPGPTSYEIKLGSELHSGYDMQCDDPDVHIETYWIPQGDNAAVLGPTYLSISDRNFQGQKKTLRVTTGYGDVKVIILRTLSGDYAQYRSTSVKQQETYEDPFAQPIPVYNNIGNGVGIFGGLSTSEYVIGD